MEMALQFVAAASRSRFERDSDLKLRDPDIPGITYFSTKKGGELESDCLHCNVVGRSVECTKKLPPRRPHFAKCMARMEEAKRGKGKAVWYVTSPSGWTDKVNE